MQKVLEIVDERARLLRKTIRQVEKYDYDSVEGTLRVSQNGKKLMYYHHYPQNDHKPDEYINSSNIAIARALAQKDYRKKFLREAQYELTNLEIFTSKLSKKNADHAYQSLSKERQNLINSYIQTNEEYAKEWQTKKFKASNYEPEKKVFETRRGDKVRSKSEAIIADIIYELGIPYRYEQLVHLSNGEKKAPDFTLLKVSTREVFYLEHFGMLDDEDYLNRNLHKLDDYRNSGIYTGKNLIITYDTDKCPLDIPGIKKMLKEIFQE